MVRDGLAVCCCGTVCQYITGSIDERLTCFSVTLPSFTGDCSNCASHAGTYYAHYAEESAPYCLWTTGAPILGNVCDARLHLITVSLEIDSGKLYLVAKFWRYKADNVYISELGYAQYLWPVEFPAVEDSSASITQYMDLVAGYRVVLQNTVPSNVALSSLLGEFTLDKYAVSSTTSMSMSRCDWPTQITVLGHASYCEQVLESRTWTPPSSILISGFTNGPVFVRNTAGTSCVSGFKCTDFDASYGSTEDPNDVISSPVAATLYNYDSTTRTYVYRYNFSSSLWWCCHCKSDAYPYYWYSTKTQFNYMEVKFGPRMTYWGGSTGPGYPMVCLHATTRGQSATSQIACDDISLPSSPNFNMCWRYAYNDGDMPSSVSYPYIGGSWYSDSCSVPVLAVSNPYSSTVEVQQVYS